MRWLTRETLGPESPIFGLQLGAKTSVGSLWVPWPQGSHWGPYTGKGFLNLNIGSDEKYDLILISR